MFTGIIEAVGRIGARELRGSDARMRIESRELELNDLKLGDSVAVNGVCLTAVEQDSDGFVADLSAETLTRTTLGGLEVGAAVNLEKALTPSTRLGGHLVAGHVDGVGELIDAQPDGRSQRLHFRAPAPLARYIAAKGSICIDGISLTVNEVAGSEFGVNIVPHTLAHTTLADIRLGQRVNLEVDIIARYLERMVLAGSHADMEGESASGDGAGITEALLARHGFVGVR